MAIAAANMVYSGQGPTADSQQTVQNDLAGGLARTLVGTATWTGDASTSTSTLNYIDGTAKLSFTPSGVLAFRIGGATTATIVPVSIVDNGNKQTAAITFSTTVTAATIICLIVIFG